MGQDKINKSVEIERKVSNLINITSNIIEITKDSRRLYAMCQSRRKWTL